ncbi:hypothetical protein K435DRAFT_835466 [Dendrothele bispora CBS 962.96]|uniref:Uncharacterized protein n=1 Tax=Dendrothele bispora (strain CBS 962.96) TaxID=1314807 RepID=A0A4S8MNJ5_DENBC|nr:hypothetical protein K435DRAFT_835466 [Dendrothele bispora CBS 962.96]
MATFCISTTLFCALSWFYQTHAPENALRENDGSYENTPGTYPVSNRRSRSIRLARLSTLTEDMFSEYSQIASASMSTRTYREAIPEIPQSPDHFRLRELDVRYFSPDGDFQTGRDSTIPQFGKYRADATSRQATGASTKRTRIKSEVPGNVSNGQESDDLPHVGSKRSKKSTSRISPAGPSASVRRTPSSNGITPSVSHTVSSTPGIINPSLRESRTVSDTTTSTSPLIKFVLSDNTSTLTISTIDHGNSGVSVSVKARFDSLPDQAYRGEEKSESPECWPLPSSGFFTAMNFHDPFQHMGSKPRKNFNKSSTTRPLSSPTSSITSNVNNRFQHPKSPPPRKLDKLSLERDSATRYASSSRRSTTRHVDQRMGTRPMKKSNNSSKHDRDSTARPSTLSGISTTRNATDAFQHMGSRPLEKTNEASSKRDSTTRKGVKRYPKTVQGEEGSQNPKRESPPVVIKSEPLDENMEVDYEVNEDAMDVCYEALESAMEAEHSR